MKLIVICSDKTDDVIFDSLKLILKTADLCFFAINRGVSFLSKGKSRSPVIILVQTDSINGVKDARPNILIFDEGFKIQDIGQPSNNNEQTESVALVYDDFDSSIAQFLKEKKYIAISCGINPKDSVTVSSITDDSISIFIQRELKDLNFKKIEQQEVCINAGDVSGAYGLMTAAVSAMLLGLKKEFFEKIIF